MKRTTCLTTFVLVAAASTGCFGRIDPTASDQGVDPNRPVPSGPDPVPLFPSPAPTDAPGASQSGAAPACWQEAPNVPPSTGPSGRIGSCSLVGTWDFEVGSHPQPKLPKAVWSFDDQGRVVGGPPGTDVCTAFQWYGSYTLGDKGFATKDLRGKDAPSCGWSGGSTFTAEFSDDCRTLTLPRIVTDSCTGGALFYAGKLTRRD